MLKHQSGVTLLEILIALALLAIAVLGFSAMQMRAVKATDETLYRSDALVAIRNISEDLRIYPTPAKRSEYMNAVNKYAGQSTVSASVNCNNTQCNASQQLDYNAAQSVGLAKDNGISIQAVTCPGLNTASSMAKMCLVAAWGNTQPSMAGGENACTDSKGVYQKGATCFVVETY